MDRRGCARACIQLQSPCYHLDQQGAHSLTKDPIVTWVAGVEEKLTFSSGQAGTPSPAPKPVPTSQPSSLQLVTTATVKDRAIPPSSTFFPYSTYPTTTTTLPVPRLGPTVGTITYATTDATANHQIHVRRRGLQVPTPQPTSHPTPQPTPEVDSQSASKLTSQPTPQRSLQHSTPQPTLHPTPQAT